MLKPILRGGEETILPIRTLPRGLVVDDGELNRDLLEAILASEGYEIVHAGDGDTALEIVGRGDVDVVLLDVLMPGLDGYEVCRRIRRDLGKAFLPVVLVTALHDREARIR